MIQAKTGKQKKKQKKKGKKGPQDAVAPSMQRKSDGSDADAPSSSLNIQVCGSSIMLHLKCLYVHQACFTEYLLIMCFCHACIEHQKICWWAIIFSLFHDLACPSLDG